MACTAISCSPRGWMVPSNEMVYIVDDDASVREALSSLLRANGKQVQMFTSGQEFLVFPREDSCACLILDLRMPGLNGLQVQKSIAAQTTIPVIFITGRGDAPSTVTAMKGGAMDFLTKPIDETALLACIEKGTRAGSETSVGCIRTGKSTRPLPIIDSKRTTSVAAVGTWSFEQAGSLGIRNHGVYRADTPGSYHAENGSRFFRNSG
jgi:DNA-binding response OmpR family regulator